MLFAGLKFPSLYPLINPFFLAAQTNFANHSSLTSLKQLAPDKFSPVDAIIIVINSARETVVSGAKSSVRIAFNKTFLF